MSLPPDIDAALHDYWNSDEVPNDWSGVRMVVVRAAELARLKANPPTSSESSPRSSLPLEAFHESKGLDAGAALGNLETFVRPAQRYPCSPTCTHDGATEPSHAARVAKASQAFNEATAGGMRACRSEEDGKATFYNEGYDKGAEAMRAACWEALQDHLRKNGYCPEAHPAAWEGFKAAIEGAAP